MYNCFGMKMSMMLLVCWQWSQRQFLKLTRDQCSHDENFVANWYCGICIGYMSNTQQFVIIFGLAQSVDSEDRVSHWKLYILLFQFGILLANYQHQRMNAISFLFWAKNSMWFNGIFSDIYSSNTKRRRGNASNAINLLGAQATAFPVTGNKFRSVRQTHRTGWNCRCCSHRCFGWW